MDGFTNPFIGPAPAEVSVHGLRNLVVAWVRGIGQQRCSRHNLPRLAITALRNLFGDPCLLQGVQAICAQAFNGGDRFPRGL